MPPSPHHNGRYRIEALAKGLLFLRQFDEQTVSLKLSDISKATGIPMPTAFRIASTLEEEGYLTRTIDGSYQPDVATLMLGSAALRGSSLVQIADKTLRDLAQRTGETVNLGVLRGDQVLYLIRLRNSDLVTANIQVGSTLPAVYTSMGKMLLAHQDEDTVRSLITPDSFASGAGPNALTDTDALIAELKKIRKQGYSIQDQELAQGLRSVSLPVTGREDQVVAAVNIAVSAVRRDAKSLRTILLDQLREAATEISRKLAHI